VVFKGKGYWDLWNLKKAETHIVMKATNISKIIGNISNNKSEWLEVWGMMESVKVGLL
jgi:hypothetical protein